MKRHYHCSIILSVCAFLFVLFVTNSSHAVFPKNPLPNTVMLQNPLRNETGYTYTYYKTNEISRPSTSTASESFIVDKVKGFREGGNPLWNKTNGWTIGTNGLYKSRSGRNPHYGVDLAANIGTAVSAVDAGTVTFHYQPSWKGEGKWDVNKGAGFYATVTHQGNLKTLYFHLTQFSYAVLDPTKATVIDTPGEHIANSGASGNATVRWVSNVLDSNGNLIDSRYEIDDISGPRGGPHLHFEVRASGISKDPLLYLPDPDRPSARLLYVDVKDSDGETVYSNKNRNLTGFINTKGN